MPISLIVLEPKTAEYARIDVTLAPIEIFEKIWLPGIQKTNAQWLPGIQSGVDLSVGDFDAFSRELIALREWVKSSWTDVRESASVITRIETLLRTLADLSKSTDGKIKVFIG